MCQEYTQKKYKLINKNIQKIKQFIAGLLIMVNVGNFLGYLPFDEFVIPKALANEHDEENTEKVPAVQPAVQPVEDTDRDRLGIIAILAEEGLMADFDVRARIMTYAKNAQLRVPHSKSVVIEVKKDESTQKIASILEKLYFEGVDTDLIDGNPLNNNSTVEDDNQLIGVIMIGDVPLPVVYDEDGFASPSVYPYTDFYRKAFIYNYETDKFETNNKVSAPNPEIWHGLINPPNKDPGEFKNQIIAFLEKNNDYSNQKDEFADFEKRVLYANFPKMEQKMNYMDFRNYDRYIKYMEEMIFNRFNKNFLREMIAEVSADMKSDVPIMDDTTISNFFDIHTESIIKKYATNFAESLRIYRSGINDAIEDTGRWGPSQVDSPESLVTIRDEYGKYELRRKQLLLEKEVDDFIKNNIAPQDREVEVVTVAKLKVKLTVINVNADNKVFTFYSHIDGNRVLDINSADECGMQIGQQKKVNQSVLENNSILVNANRMYNPATLLTPPEGDGGWKLEEQDEYKENAGCTFNNSIELEVTGASPDKCIPADSELPLFDIIGSKEVKEGDFVYDDSNKCSTQRMSFLLTDQNQFNSVAAGTKMFNIEIGAKLNEVINVAYSGLQGDIPSPSIKQKASFVIQSLLASGDSFSYEPLNEVEIELKVETETKPIDSINPHVEPTNDTIKAIKQIGIPRVNPTTGALQFPQIITPSTPADGIRSISFARNSLNQVFEYLNLFRIDGNSPGEITGNMWSKVNQKQLELDQKTETTGNTIQEFFLQNFGMIEPIIWNAQSIDQKLAEVIPKYIDKNSFMPTPFNNPKKSPQNKPKGYEVLHIVANGDAKGYQFGLNRAMRKQANLDEEAENDRAVDEGQTVAETEENDGNANDASSGNYVCGDPSGVEIWEWFDALQCWIEEEIMPAEELFALSQSCALAHPPAKEKEKEENIFDSLLSKAASFEVDMKRKSLIVGQEVPITISAFNKAGEQVLGYIGDAINFELEDKSLGEFSANDVFIFSGSRKVKFTPKKTGSSLLTITMGDLPERKFQINVFDKIDMEWSAREKIVGGRSEFTIKISAKDPNGNDINNINDDIILAPQQPADGGFKNSGKIKLLNGRGEIGFSPTPGKKTVDLISKDEYITGNYTINPTAASATKIYLRAPPYAIIGQDTEIEVIAVNDFGIPADDFNGTITLSIGTTSSQFAKLKASALQLKNGKGTAVLEAGKKTADIQIFAKHEDLTTGKIILPLLARVDSSTWKTLYPQTLVASFVGFPAGNYLEEDYFGGVQLMAGKTQAVYSFLTAPQPSASMAFASNNLITVSGNNQTVLTEFIGNKMLLQAFDRNTMQTLFSKKVDLKFDSVERFGEGNMVPGKMYVETISEDYTLVKDKAGFQIKSNLNEVLANIQPDKINVVDAGFKWVYSTQPEFNMVELELTDGLNTIARVILNFKPKTIEPKDFEEINPNLKWNLIFGGKSVNDPTGLIFSDYNAEVPEEVRNEFYGIEGENKYISLFSSGSSFGESVKYNLPVSAILLGDPTVKLESRSLSSLNYNNAHGEQIYQDPEGSQIASINSFNFNNDGYQDIAVLLDDGRVRLLEAGPTEPIYKDKGNLALLADGGVALEALDFENDNYEDLLIATADGRLAFLNNDKEVITRADHNLNIGKKIFKLLKSDMDQDGFSDLVILDSRGDIYIFYYDPVKKSFPKSGKWIANYGFSLNLEKNLNKDIDIRFAGIPEPATAIEGIERSTVPLDEFEGGGEIDEDVALAFIKKLNDDQKAFQEDPSGTNQEEATKLPWPEGDEIESYFAPIETIDSLSVTKKVINKERPEAVNVDLDELLTYRIEINSGAYLNDVVLADTVPDSLQFDLQSVACVQGGCKNIKTQQNSIKVFFSRLNLIPGQTTVITYDVIVANTPSADILLQKIIEPNENLPNSNSIIDEYMDILVSPPYNNTGRLIFHYTTGPRTYEITQDNSPHPNPSADGTEGFAEMINQLQGFPTGELDPDNPPEPIDASFMEDSLDEATGNNDCFEDPGSAVGCIEGALDKVADAISNFACVGGGCFPTPFNYAFLVPPDMPFPVMAYPSTLATTAGPMPMVSSLFFPLPGMSSITGPIMSQIRLYVAPTLTGGIGIATCWGPYPTSPTVPPPLFPIPYPPPTGNCMVVALPVSEAKICKRIENSMNKVMAFINSGISKIDSAISDINNNPNIPVDINQSGPDQGAGGLEIGLAIALGNSTRFEPPAKSFSNINIPGFDSISGVLSSWLDRQMLEIQNKLLTMPTFSIYMPDFKSLFTLDASRTKKRYDQWINTIKGSAAASLDTIEQIDGQKQASNVTKDQTVGQKLRNGLQDVKGSKALKFTRAVETQTSIYNLNALEGLYDIASTLPLVRLTEKPIQLDVPWLSAAEIQDYILELQNYVLYYENEYARVKDIWESLKCDDQPDPGDNGGFGNFAKNKGECLGRTLADGFGLSFDDFINSIKQNIEVLQLWLTFPREIVLYKQELVGYISAVACYLETLAQLMGGYVATLQEQMVSWAEVVFTIIEIVKNIKELFDVFTDYDSNCEICTNERYANFGWWSLLGLILPDIPIIEFPKIPNIVLDMSDIDIAIDIEMPALNIRPNPFPLPPLPYIRLPDFPNISIFLSLPPLPLLPGPPELPPLPDLPPLPTVDLPTLPAPPKLPDIGKAFEVIIPLIEKILNIWCLMKKSFAPVPEMMLKDQIVLLTNRPAYLIPLDILKPQLPKITIFDLGFNEVRIETIIYIGLRLNMIVPPIEKAADDWNGWIDLAYKQINEAYDVFLEKTEVLVQGYLDEAENIMDEGAANFEKAFDEYVQDWLDKNVGDPMEEADQWLRDAEAVFEEWKENNTIDWDYEEYYENINQVYASLNKFNNSSINEWFDNNRELSNGLSWIAWGPVLEFITDDNIAFVADKLSEANDFGPTQLNRLYACLRNYNDCRQNEEKYFGPDEQSSAKDVKDIPKAPVQVVYNPSAQQLNNERRAKQLLGTPQGKEIRSLINDIGDVIDDVNNNDLVDYRVLKERFGVADYKFNPGNPTVDKLRLMQKQLTRNSERLMVEVQSLRNVQDLTAFAGVPPRSELPYELASTIQNGNNKEVKVYSSDVDIPKRIPNNANSILQNQVVELKKQMERRTNQLATLPVKPEQKTGCDVAVCLPDPITNSPVPVIPAIEFYASSETLFMPNGNLVYSDGTGLFLKRDLTVDDSDKNQDTGNPRRFSLKNFMNKLQMEDEPKQAINMLTATLTENQAATFNWLPVNNPSFYGYGIEVERTITGYDRNKQNNKLADTKIILLPANNGKAPEVLAGDQIVNFGTLITSLTDADTAATRFGVKPDNIILGQSEVSFPTISNAKINLDENKAVFFDQLKGSAYSMAMENGFHQIKMTWFDENARTATYNQNEILAPQIYAGAAEPIDVSQQDIYYMPIFKEKNIQASEIFVDLSGAYKYYWYLNPESNQLTPFVGETLTIPPQDKIKKFDIKLVATQDITDESFERFEKVFSMQVYVPEIELDQDSLNKGLIVGNMTPIPEVIADDLSDIPFSLFRKRAGVWKNLGLLREKNPDKAPTTPPFNDDSGRKYIFKDSYYTVDTNGNYQISGLDILDASPTVMKDFNGNVIAEVEPGNGQINLFDENFELQAVPASADTPTHVAIILKETKELFGNVYYIAKNTKKITIMDSGLTIANVADEGVTVGDANLGDVIVTANIPDNGPSFPGGVSIFNEVNQTNVALVDKDGTIRMMQAGYDLSLKNGDSENGKYIFQIVDQAGNAVFDIFIQADWNKLERDMSTVMDNLDKQIGLVESKETAFAQQSPQKELEPKANNDPVSPFPDLDPSHPFFKQILSLYEARVVSGYGDGSFKPDQKLTRAEFIKIALGVTNCLSCENPTDPQRARYIKNPFPDVALLAWYFYCISMAKELGMITGYGDGLFRPEQNISRAEAAAVLIRQSDIEITKAPESAFKDVPDYAWYVDYVYTAVEIGLIKENFGFVNPDEKITRGEFAFMAAGLQDFQQCKLVDSDGDNVPDWWEMENNMDPLVPDAETACPCYDNPNQTDTDADGTKDVCDFDIDNDSVLNPICIFDDQGELSDDLISAGASALGEAVDNCIFIPNTEQEDFDNNGIGNVCDSLVICPCLDNPNRNDTDVDGIPDVCDNDIDNDTITNPICIFDDNGLIDLSMLGKNDDNCVFTQNPLQEDTSKNGIGDACISTDLCPAVPEDLDGVDDGDGCPEVDDNFPEKDPGIYLSPGPLCSLLDDKSDFMPDDVFMTAITDIKTHEVTFSKSSERNYQP